jgi:hypothetical protein
MFRHPKYYKELRKLRNKLDQAISEPSATAQVERAPDPGPKQQATSYKLPGPRPISNANKGLIHKRQATSSQASSGKRQALQAASFKLQAASDKLSNPQAFIKFQAASIRGLDEGLHSC